jgi:hypothetical protein
MMRDIMPKLNAVTDTALWERIKRASALALALLRARTLGQARTAGICKSKSPYISKGSPPERTCILRFGSYRPQASLVLMAKVPWLRRGRFSLPPHRRYAKRLGEQIGAVGLR